MEDLMPEFSMLSVIVTDAARGSRADGVRCLVEHQVDGNWKTVMRGASDSSGTISAAQVSTPGIYRVELDTDPYFAVSGTITFLPKITLTFRIPESCVRSVLSTHIAPNAQFSVLIRNDR
jgi:5-hydroxyisourate hydrolase-like protein (transthyretin family)